jgi:hypothetical protein
MNIEKTKYNLLSHHQNAVQNWDIKIDCLKMYHSSNIGNASNKSKFDSEGH